jgi:hypothetical protein
MGTLEIIENNKGMLSVALHVNAADRWRWNMDHTNGY